VLHGQKDLQGVDTMRLAKTVGDAMDQAQGQYLHGLVPDIICILVFNTATRTLFPRNLLEGLNLQYFKEYD
jgi:hypothetical protein